MLGARGMFHLFLEGGSMYRRWSKNPIEMEKTLAEARKAGSIRLLALIFDEDTPAEWSYYRTDAEMRGHLASRYKDSAELKFSQMIAVIVVNPGMEDAAIQAMVDEKRARHGAGLGYFEEFLSWQAGQ